MPLDVSQVYRAEREGGTALDSLPDAMRVAAQMGAAYERGHKTYQNRTWRLIRSTVGKVDTRSRDRVVVILEMGMEYASFVKARGYSAIETARAMTVAAVDDAIARVSTRIGKL